MRRKLGRNGRWAACTASDSFKETLIVVQILVLYNNHSKIKTFILSSNTSYILRELTHWRKNCDIDSVYELICDLNQSRHCEINILDNVPDLNLNYYVIIAYYAKLLIITCFSSSTQTTNISTFLNLTDLMCCVNTSFDNKTKKNICTRHDLFGTFCHDWLHKGAAGWHDECDHGMLQLSVLIGRSQPNF